MRIVKLAKKNDVSIEDKVLLLKNIRIFLLNNDIANDICEEFGYDKMHEMLSQNIYKRDEEKLELEDWLENLKVQVHE